MEYMEIIVGSIWAGGAVIAMDLWKERRKNSNTISLDELIKMHS